MPAHKGGSAWVVSVLLCMMTSRGNSLPASGSLALLPVVCPLQASIASRISCVCFCRRASADVFLLQVGGGVDDILILGVLRLALEELHIVHILT